MDKSLKERLAAMPCHPCPHRSLCCCWGTYLTNREAGALLIEFGTSHVYFDVDSDEWRTQVLNGRCIFFNGVGCQIHSHKHYPATCLKFPVDDARDPSKPYAHDAADICPSAEAIIKEAT